MAAGAGVDDMLGIVGLVGVSVDVARMLVETEVVVFVGRVGWGVGCNGGWDVGRS